MSKRRAVRNEFEIDSESDEKEVPASVEPSGANEPRQFVFVVQKARSSLSKKRKYILFNEHQEELCSFVSKRKKRKGVVQISEQFNLVISSDGTVFMMKASDSTQKLKVYIEFKAVRDRDSCARQAIIEFPGDPQLPKRLISFESLPVMSGSDARRDIFFAIENSSSAVLAIQSTSKHRFEVSTSLALEPLRLLVILGANFMAKIPESIHIKPSAPKTNSGPNQWQPTVSMYDRA